MSDRYAIKRIEGLEDQLATLRSEVASVRVHLESYAEKLEKFGLPGDSQPTKEQFIAALREDSERLGKLGGGD